MVLANKWADGPPAYSTPLRGLNRVVALQIPMYRGGALVVLSCEVSVIPLYAFNTPPMRNRVRRGELILSRGAIIAVCAARPQQPGRAGEVIE